MKKTGSLLKSKREASNLSLGEVALATKINPKILTAIENGDEHNLPAKTFLKGFVRAYALFLKMDIDEVMRTFQEETGGPPPDRAAEAPRAAETATSRRDVHQESSSAMRTVAVVVIIVLIGLIIGIRELIEKYSAESVKPTDPQEMAKLTPVPGTAPAEGAAPGAETPKADGAAVDGNSGVAPGIPSPAPASTAASTAAPADEKKAAEEKLAAEKKAAEEKKAADEKKAAEEKAAAEKKIADEKKAAEEKKAADKKAAEEKLAAEKKAAEEKKAADEKKAAEDKRIAEEKKAAEAKRLAEEKKAAEEKKTADKKAADEKAAQEAANKPETPLKSVKNEIILEALGNVEVRFSIRGQEKKVTLAANEVHTIHADQPLSIDLSDGGAVTVIVNGRERGVPGDQGKPKTIKVP